MKKTFLFTMFVLLTAAAFAEPYHHHHRRHRHHHVDVVTREPILATQLERLNLTEGHSSLPDNRTCVDQKKDLYAGRYCCREFHKICGGHDGT
jgi:hypothetical protein